MKTPLVCREDWKKIPHSFRCYCLTHGAPILHDVRDRCPCCHAEELGRL